MTEGKSISEVLLGPLHKPVTPAPSSDAKSEEVATDDPVAEEVEQGAVKDGTPQFLLEASNPICLRAMRHIIAEADSAGLSPEYIQWLATIRGEMTAWQKKNGTKPR